MEEVRLPPALTFRLVGEAKVPILKVPPPLMVKLVVVLYPLSKPMVTRPFTLSDLPAPMIILLVGEVAPVSPNASTLILVCTRKDPTVIEAAVKSSVE